MMQFNPASIKEKRRQMGFSQQQVADLVGISKGYISDIENGKKQTISPATYKTLMEVLGLKEFPYSERFRMKRTVANLACGRIRISEAIHDFTDMAQKLSPTSELLWDVQFELAKQYYLQNEYQNSQTYCKLAYESARRSGDYVSEYKCMILQSLIDGNKGFIHLALERLLLLESSYSHTSRPIPPILNLILYGTLASLYERINRTEEASFYMEKVESYLIQIPILGSDGSTSSYLLHLLDCAYALEQNGAMRDAQQMYEACISIARWVEQFMYQLTIQLEMAELELRHGKLTPARLAIESVRGSLEQYGFQDRPLYYETLNVATELYILQQSFQTAEDLANFVLEACQDRELGAAAIALRNKARIQLAKDQHVTGYEALMKEAIGIVSKEKVAQFRGLIKDIPLHQHLQHEYLEQKSRILSEP